MESRSKLRGYFTIIRPMNAFIALFTSWVAMLIVVQPLAFDVYLYIGITAFFVSALGNTHNDLMDIEIDRINAPNRVLPSGILDKKEVRRWIIIMLMIALTSAVTIDIRLQLSIPFSLIWTLFNIIIIFSYNIYFKKNGFIGNFIISYSVSAIFLYADLLINQTILSDAGLIGLYALFFNWSREIIKGINDIEGDITCGVNTIAIKYGAKKASKISFFILIIGVITSIPLVLENGSIIPIVLLFLNTVAIVKNLQLIQDPQPQIAYKTKNFIKIAMLIAVLSVVVQQIVLIIN